MDPEDDIFRGSKLQVHIYLWEGVVWNVPLANKHKNATFKCPMKSLLEGHLYRGRPLRVYGSAADGPWGSKCKDERQQLFEYV